MFDVSEWGARKIAGAVLGVTFVLGLALGAIYCDVVGEGAPVAGQAQSPVDYSQNPSAAPVYEQDPAWRERTRATQPVWEVGDFADRVFYMGDGSREWGTLCKLGSGWISVHHVTANGTPVVGPTAQVTAFNEPSDWSFVGIDPMNLDVDNFGELTIGEAVTIMGYPARDRDGENIPAKVYLNDPNPPFMWLELQPLAGGAPPEGVVGGVSGSCVLGDDGRVEGVVHANGFSPIEGTTNTWALVVPIRAAILEAQGKIDLSMTAQALAKIDPAAIPKLETGRYGLFGGAGDD